MKMHGLSVKNDLSPIGLIKASKDLSEGALSCPVLTHERVASARFYVDRDIVERLNSGKSFANVTDRENGHGL